jgi:hypothetical protein
MPSTNMAIPSATRVVPKLRAAWALDSVPASRSVSKTWKIVNPKPISDSAVRITDISMRSALMRVRWNDMPVRRDDSSTEMRSGSEAAVTGGLRLLSSIANRSRPAISLPRGTMAGATSARFAQRGRG